MIVLKNITYINKHLANHCLVRLLSFAQKRFCKEIVLHVPLFHMEQKHQ